MAKGTSFHAKEVDIFLVQMSIPWQPALLFFQLYFLLVIHFFFVLGHYFRNYNGHTGFIKQQKYLLSYFHVSIFHFFECVCVFFISFSFLCFCLNIFYSPIYSPSFFFPFCIIHQWSIYLACFHSCFSIPPFHLGLSRGMIVNFIFNKGYFK